MYFSRIILPTLLSLVAVAAASPDSYSGGLELRDVDFDSYLALRALPVTFSDSVKDKTNKADRKRITSDVRAHHKALPEGHAAHEATGAHVWKEPHTDSPEDPRKHSTVDFHNNGAHITTHHVLHQRALPVTFSHDVHASTNKAERKKITSDVRAHHKALPDNHAAKGADGAHVWKGPHTDSPDDPVNHSTVDFHKDGQHVTTHHVYHRALPVTFSHDVHASTNKAERKKITSDVRAHHKALPDNHAAKGADGAHVWKGPHTDSPDDPANHSTVDFHKDGQHVTTHHVYHRALPVTFSHDVHSSTNKAERKKITSDVRAHHKALPDNHAAKGADGAHVWKGPHTDSPDDPANHSTVDFHKDGQHVTTHHVYH